MSIIILVTYLIMPVGSMVFILFINLISVNAEKTERYIRTTWL